MDGYALQVVERCNMLRLFQLTIATVFLGALVACGTTSTPVRVASPAIPTNTLEPTYTPKPTNTPEPTDTPKPTNTLRPTSTPRPEPTLTQTPASKWERYKPNTFEQIVAENSQEMVNEPAGYYVPMPELPAKVKVVYTGKTRNTSKERLAFIYLWAKTVGAKIDDSNQVFGTEMLFKEGSREYWLPVQTQLIPFFRDELKVGDEVTLYTIWIGTNIKEDRSTDWVFLVNEFTQKP